MVFLYCFGFIWLFLLVIYFQKNLRLECRSLISRGEGTKKPSRGGLGDYLLLGFVLCLLVFFLTSDLATLSSHQSGMGSGVTCSMSAIAEIKL